MSKQIKKVGRPKVNINLVELQKLCTLNCTMPEIAHFFDIPLRTLEDRFKNDQDVRNAIEKGRSQGKLSVRRKQLQIMDENNNATMAIWLGKQLLGQRDKHDIVTEDKAETKLTEALEIIQEMARNKDK